MTLHIGADRITCEASSHTAWRISAPDSVQCWRVTWLSGRLLTRNQAITAMTLAEVLAPGVHPDRASTAALGAWAAELGLSPDQVITYLHGRGTTR
jgi:hypothetical protein